MGFINSLIPLIVHLSISYLIPLYVCLPLPSLQADRCGLRLRSGSGDGYAPRGPRTATFRRLCGGHPAVPDPHQPASPCFLHTLVPFLLPVSSPLFYLQSPPSRFQTVSPIPTLSPRCFREEAVAPCSVVLKHSAFGYLTTLFGGNNHLDWSLARFRNTVFKATRLN